MRFSKIDHCNKPWINYTLFCLFVCIVCFSVCLFVCLSVFLSVCLYIRHFGNDVNKDINSSHENLLIEILVVIVQQNFRIIHRRESKCWNSNFPNVPVKKIFELEKKNVENFYVHIINRDRD